jgi:probable rRNA maturation factor
MTVTIDVDEPGWSVLPDLEAMTRAAAAATFTATGFDGEACETAILFTGDAAMAEINGRWRGKPQATNVLSFPAPADQPVPDGEARPLGDIVLALGVVTREAAEQAKPLKDHVSHLIIHGLLHLLGQTHEDEAEAHEMESLERQIMKGLGFTDPYYERPGQ